MEKKFSSKKFRDHVEKCELKPISSLEGEDSIVVNSNHHHDMENSLLKVNTQILIYKAQYSLEFLYIEAWKIKDSTRTKRDLGAGKGGKGKEKGVIQKKKEDRKKRGIFSQC